MERTPNYQPDNSPTEETGSSSLNPLASHSLPDAGRTRRIDFGVLRQQVTIEQVLELLAWRPVSGTGMQLRGPCPIHRSSNPESRSFSVNLQKNAFQCFGCGKKGNQLDLYAAATSLSLYAAARELVTRVE